MNAFLVTFWASLAALTAVAVTAFLIHRAVLNWFVDRTLVRILKDKYSENLWDLVLGMTRIPPTMLMELELRAEYGDALSRPLGGVRRLPDFNGISFRPAQLVRPPRPVRSPVKLKTRLGPRCRHPLRLEMPILISALPFGVALAENFVLGLAHGATLAGTAYNAGPGPLLPEVRQAARHLILQYSGGSWTRDPEVLAQGDMIEIRLGQGARVSLGRVVPAAELPPRAQRMLGIGADGEAVLEAPVPGAATPAELRRLVTALRELIPGRPVGVKLAATHDVERELAAVLEAGVDVIAIDGAQGGSHGSPPIIADDFGIPTVHALLRAVRFLEASGSREDVSLIIGGGLRTPGEMLKALALGADAVYIGTAAMMGCTHGQLSQSVPFEPITAIAWSNGARAHRFDARKGADTVANYLNACALELEEAVRALGKQSVHEVSRADLVAIDAVTADTLGLPPSWQPPDA